MSFVEAVTYAIQDFAVFEGRSRRSEYWYYYLFTCLVGLALGIIFGIIARLTNFPLLIVQSVLIFIVCIPQIALTVRRLHDTNKSGWYWFVIFIPFVGVILFFYWLVKDSDYGDNDYGASPK